MNPEDYRSLCLMLYDMSLISTPPDKFMDLKILQSLDIEVGKLLVFAA